MDKTHHQSGGFVMYNDYLGPIGLVNLLVAKACGADRIAITGGLTCIIS